MVMGKPGVTYVCNGALQTSSNGTHQEQTCNHNTRTWDPHLSTLLPCDRCILKPLVPGEDSTYTSDFDENQLRTIGVTVNYTCNPGFTTASGNTSHTQQCDISGGWVGDVEDCSRCEPPALTVLYADVNTSGGPGFGLLNNYTCQSGLSASTGQTEMMSICTPEGWYYCPADFNCTYCVGLPPNVTGSSLITSNWTGDVTVGTVIAYSCSDGLSMKDGETEQIVQCSADGGWTQQELVPCDQCPNPPSANDSTIASFEKSGEGALTSSYVFLCAEGLNTEDFQTSITSVCTENGWSRCQQEIRCQLCAPLPDASTWDGTLSWADPAENRVGTNVTFTCNPGTATPNEGLREQTVVCGPGGWNVSEVQPCSVCIDPPPNATSSMLPVDWRKGDAEVTYTCLPDLQLPWNFTQHATICSPIGWEQCIPECTVCIPSKRPPHVRLVSMDTQRNGSATYNCTSGGISTVNGTSDQQLVCTETGWSGGPLVACDTCIGDPPSAVGDGQNRSWSGVSVLHSSATYGCDGRVVTRKGYTTQTVWCTEQGWSRPPTPCDHCVLPELPGTAVDWTNGTFVPLHTEVMFTCLDGNRLLSTNSTSQTISCLQTGWSAELGNCVACTDDIPDPTSNGTESRNVTWDGSRHLDAAVHYTCNDTGLNQTVTCVDFRWTPAQLGPCVLPTELPPGEITMAPLPPYDPRYPATTDYYWGTIENDMEESAAGGSFTTGNGPLGFDSSIQLDGIGCMSKKGWAMKNDPCANNPANCEKGFSFSLWVKLQLHDGNSMFEDREESTSPAASRQYLMSTGGDENGHPGVAIYVQDHSLNALVSTGGRYWFSSVTGLLRNNSWVNIGVRWAGGVPFDNSKYGGLQIVINNVTESYTVSSKPSKAPATQGLDPGEIMVGCHRTASKLAYRHKAIGEFDEVAMWTRPLLSNETIFFIGGYDAKDEGVDMEELKKLFKKCVQCREDPVQFEAFISKVLVSAKTAPTPADPTVASTVAGGGGDGADADIPGDVEQAPPEQVEKIKGLASLMYDLTDSCKTPMGKEEISAFMAISQVLDESMEMKTLPQWRTVEYTSKEDGGAATVVTRLENWVLDCSSHIPMEPKDDVFVDKPMKNVHMQMRKMKTFNFRQKPVATFPSGQDDNSLNTASFATELFDRGDECIFADMSILFANYKTYGMISPRRASLLELESSDEDRLEVDGNVLSLQLRMNDDLDGSNTGVAANCTPTKEYMRTYPVWFSIEHTSPRKALRKALFHEEEINTGIYRRVCVWWNPALSDYGSWDADGCKALVSTDFYTKCACTHFGQFAIIIEKVSPKIVPTEYEWLKIVKYVCYSVSALLLIIFIVAVIAIRQLHEMFHLMRMQTAIGLFFGSAFMVLTDIPEIREDRHICVAFAAVIQVFYLLAGCMVAMEGAADFQSMTNGAIGGKLRAYSAISWGIPLISLGYTFMVYLPDYGTDPRCMLGWPDHVKMTMFVPLIVTMCCTALFASLVSCNMAASKLRKENIVAEQLTVCKGYVFFGMFFVATWIVGVLAYLRLGISIPGFYPLFQVLNSTNGIMFFLFCGISSERFRLLLTGKAKLRKQNIISSTISEQLPSAQLPAEVERPPTPPEPAPFDPNVRAPRKALVA